jgi:hypothetical protein
MPVFARTRGLAASASSHASAPVTARRVEVLSTLRTSAAHFLLAFQLWCRLVDVLPATAAITRPVTVIPVVRYRIAVLAA